MFFTMSLRKFSSTSSRAETIGSILLVDDNKLGLSARKTVLEELGHSIWTASNGVDALEQFGSGKFDLVVTDYKMPRMDGLELIVGLRKITPNLPVILISGFVDALGLSEHTTGADVVIQKSANEVSHLVRAVARLMRKKPVKKPAGSEGARVAKRKLV
jgi:CheY-like chemotaxis protein